jgi:hypothetical protein
MTSSRRTGPYAGDDPIAVKFNAITKYVATSEPQTLSWQNSVALRGDPAAEVAALKRQDGRKLLLQGSSELIHALLAKDLIDEITLLTFPVVLGKGKRLSARAPCLPPASWSRAAPPAPASSWRPIAVRARSPPAPSRSPSRAPPKSPAAKNMRPGAEKFSEACRSGRASFDVKTEGGISRSRPKRSQRVEMGETDACDGSGQGQQGQRKPA